MSGRPWGSFGSEEKEGIAAKGILREKVACCEKSRASAQQEYEAAHVPVFPVLAAALLNLLVFAPNLSKPLVRPVRQVARGAEK
jgi:hypothetical protein